jgi:putative phosphoribosyl transferase
MKTTMKSHVRKTEVQIPTGMATLNGELEVPSNAEKLVLFAHGSGSSRHSPRNQFVAMSLRAAGLGTLLFDLLTRQEEVEDARTAQLRFDIGLLARRLVAATHWVRNQREAHDLRVGYFGSSTGGGAALVAAAQLGEDVSAVVSRGGRPDLAGAALAEVKCPTLLIVGGLDHAVIELNQQAFERLPSRKELKIIPGATHLFEEPGTLDEVARLAADWFRAV